MDGRETLEARLHGRDSVVLDVWYYCNVVSMMLCACGVVYIYSVYIFQCDVHGGTYSVV